MTREEFLNFLAHILEGELNLRDKYEKAIYKLVEMGKLGWSSGSMGHISA